MDVDEDGENYHGRYFAFRLWNADNVPRNAEMMGGAIVPDAYSILSERH